jgi:hypothetical protein
MEGKLLQFSIEQAESKGKNAAETVQKINVNKETR